MGAGEIDLAAGLDAVGIRHGGGAGGEPGLQRGRDGGCGNGWPGNGNG